MSLAIAILLLTPGAPLAAASIPDTELAEQRGGFTLPNGVDVALTVQTQTAINGNVVLRTVFRADQGPATLAVYAPKPGEQVAAQAGTAGGATAMPVVTYDSRTGIQVASGAGRPAVSIATQGMAGEALPTGLARIDAATGTVTDNGVVTQTTRGALQTAELTAGDLSIAHLAGSAFGSAIANSGSDRAIDTQTTIGLDLRNAGPQLLGSAMLRVEDMTTAAMQFRQ